MRLPFGVVIAALCARRLGAMSPLLQTASTIVKPLLTPAAAVLPVQAGVYDAAAVRTAIDREISEYPVVIYGMDFSFELRSAVSFLEKQGARGVKVVSLGTTFLPGLVADGATCNELYTMTGQLPPHIFIGGESIGGVFSGTPGLFAAANDGSLVDMLKDANAL